MGLGKLLLFSVLTIPSNVFSLDNNTELLKSSRALAMGNAHLSLVDDGMSLFYNPAGLAKIQKPHFKIIDIGLGLDSDFSNQKLASAASATSLGGLKKIAKANPGVNYSYEAQVFPHFIAKNIGIGLFGRAESGARYLADSDELHYKSKYVGGFVIGIGMKLFSGIIKLGYDLKYIDYAAGEFIVPYDSADGFRLNLPEGKGIAHSAGTIITLPFKFLPSFGVTARNIGKFKPFGGGYISKPNAGDPPEMPMVIDAGMAIQPFIAGKSRINIALDYKDATSAISSNPMSKINLGMELEINYSVFFRGGWGKGYPSAGFGLKTKRETFDITMYGDEVGSSYRQMKDVRYIIRYSGGI